MYSPFARPSSEWRLSMRQHARTPVRISVECVLLYQVSLYIGGSKLRGRLGNNQPDYPSELLVGGGLDWFGRIRIIIDGRYKRGLLCRVTSSFLPQTREPLVSPLVVYSCPVDDDAVVLLFSGESSDPTKSFRARQRPNPPTKTKQKENSFFFLYSILWIIDLEIEAMFYEYINRLRDGLSVNVASFFTKIFCFSTTWIHLPVELRLRDTGVPC